MLILKELRNKNKKGVTISNLRDMKELWLDKLRYKKIKLQNCVERRRRKQDNIMFQRDQKGFFRKLGEDGAHEERMPNIGSFVEFWGGIWEKKENTPYMPWAEEIGRQLKLKVKSVNEFQVTFENLKKEGRKRNRWTAPAIDGIQNYWWKKLESGQKALTRAFIKLTENNHMIPIWWPSGRTVLLPKTKNLENEKKYIPVTCLNTSRRGSSQKSDLCSQTRRIQL